MEVIEKGQTLVNPVTGERMTFLETAAETGGDRVVIELHADPGGSVAAAHVHPSQWETFDVVSGTLGAKVGGRKTEAGAGRTLAVAPGVPHTWWNAGDDELVFRCVISPALQFESLIETMFSLAADGKTNKKGMPPPFRLSVIAKAHFDTVQLPVVPAWMQRTALAMGAPFGRAIGYGPTYTAERPALERLVPQPA
jgi:quercetin dioxygenase-like cupin family protein